MSTLLLNFFPATPGQIITGLLLIFSAMLCFLIVRYILNRSYRGSGSGFDSQQISNSESVNKVLSKPLLSPKLDETIERRNDHEASESKSYSSVSDLNVQQDSGNKNKQVQNSNIELSSSDTQEVPFIAESDTKKIVTKLQSDIGHTQSQYEKINKHLSLKSPDNHYHTVETLNLEYQFELPNDISTSANDSIPSNSTIHVYSPCDSQGGPINESSDAMAMHLKSASLQSATIDMNNSLQDSQISDSHEIQEQQQITTKGPDHVLRRLNPTSKIRTQELTRRQQYNEFASSLCNVRGEDLFTCDYEDEPEQHSNVGEDINHNDQDTESDLFKCDEDDHNDSSDISSKSQLQQQQQYQHCSSSNTAGGGSDSEPDHENEQTNSRQQYSGSNMINNNLKSSDVNDLNQNQIDRRRNFTPEQQQQLSFSNYCSRNQDRPLFQGGSRCVTYNKSRTRVIGNQSNTNSVNQATVTNLDSNFNESNIKSDEQDTGLKLNKKSFKHYTNQRISTAPVLQIDNSHSQSQSDLVEQQQQNNQIETQISRRLAQHHMNLRYPTNLSSKKTKTTNTTFGQDAIRHEQFDDGDFSNIRLIQRISVTGQFNAIARPMNCELKFLEHLAWRLEDTIVLCITEVMGAGDVQPIIRLNNSTGQRQPVLTGGPGLIGTTNTNSSTVDDYKHDDPLTIRAVQQIVEDEYSSLCDKYSHGRLIQVGSDMRFDRKCASIKIECCYKGRNNTEKFDIEFNVYWKAILYEEWAKENYL